MTLFKDRIDAGEQLAEELTEYKHKKDVIVLGLPRGGIPVAYKVAEELDAPLDVFIVRKLGVPGHKELAMGAIASGDIRVLNERIVNSLGISNKSIASVAAQEERELERRQNEYRGDRPMPELSDKIILLIDDGIATGATMRAAIEAINSKNPKKLVVAVPTAAHDTCESLKEKVDKLICLKTPQPFFGVGRWYQHFGQTTDEEVKKFLDKSENVN